jgi:hypothetical protein
VDFWIWDFRVMARLFIFADEAGCFNFSRNQGASKYYIVCTISCRSCADLGSTLLDLRRQLVWENAPIGEYFHASEDKQVVRDRVFKALQKHDFSIQATIMEKSKALPRIRPTHHRFYQYGWFYHFKHAAPKSGAAVNSFSPLAGRRLGCYAIRPLPAQRGEVSCYPCPI